MKPRHYRMLREKAKLQDNGEITGYIAKFGVESEVLYDENVCDGPFVEVIDPGFFDGSLETNDIVCLVNHDHSKPIGRTSENTLMLEVDNTGLKFRCLPGDNTIGKDARITVGRRDASGCSFGFEIFRSDLTERDGKPPLHTLYDGNVFEVSTAVTFPAYLQTESQARNRKLPATIRPGRARHLRAMFKYLTRNRTR